MSEWTLYLIVVVNNINCFLTTTLILSGFAISLTILVIQLAYLASGDNTFIRKVGVISKKVIKHPACIIFLVLTMLFSILVPSYKEIAAIYIIPKVVNAQITQKLPETINLFLNKYIKEMSDEKH